MTAARAKRKREEDPNGHETVQKETERLILAELARLGGNLIEEDALEFTGKKVILPESMAGDINAAIKWLSEHQEQQETEHRFRRTFRYRPLDGAYALYAALRTIWGNTGLGKGIHSFFGYTPPTFITIDVGVNQTAQVPQGRIDFPPLKAEIYLGGTNDPDLGALFELIVDCPRKFRGHVEGLFLAVENELRKGSIYKGKAITGADIPTYIDTTKVDPDKVVFSEEVLTQLGANIWSVLRHSDQMRKYGMTLKRAVLLAGEYGTGKTLTAYLTAQVAEAMGWTFVFCRPGQDDLERTMKTALLYAPAVVFFEDIDVLAEHGEPEAVQRLLDLFDGITAKNQDCLAVLTTNHLTKIHRAMLRPGRLDAVIQLGGLDAFGLTRLIRAKVPAEQLGDLDIDRIAQAMDGFLPAFCGEAIDRAMRYSIHRTNGKLNTLETDDFVEAALGLRPQLELMEGAGEGRIPPTLDTAMRDAVREGTHSVAVLDCDGDYWGRLDAHVD